MENIFIITDVHGCYKTLMALISQLPNNAKIVLAGDLIDRGPSSKKVVDYAMENENISVTLGNHEAMAIDNFFKFIWLENGGRETLQSYEGNEITKKHIDFFKSLPLYIEYPELKDNIGRHLVVSHSRVSHIYADLEGYKQKITECPHSGELLPHHNSKEKIDYTILWGRNFTACPNKDIFNVFGHSPVMGVFKRKPHLVDHEHEGILLNKPEGYAAIDTGCSLSKYNYLAALEFPSMKVYRQKNLDH